MDKPPARGVAAAGGGGQPASPPPPQVHCVECGQVVPHLYSTYGSGAGRVIRLTRCPCGRFADKYLEFDGVVLLIDLILQKQAAYRHVLLNHVHYVPEGDGRTRGAWWRIPPGCNGNLLKLGLMTLLFEVYVKCYRLESRAPAHPLAPPYATVFGSPYADYGVILSFCLLEFLTYHVLLRALVHWCLPAPSASASPSRSRRVADYNRLSMALIFSSFGHFIMILLVIWDFQELEYAWLIQGLVLLSHSEALAVMLQLRECGASRVLPTLLVAVGLGAQWALRRALTHALPSQYVPLFSM